MEKSMGILVYFWPQKWQKMTGVSIEKLIILEESKYTVKTALTPLFKELWPIFDFLKFQNQIY